MVVRMWHGRVPAEKAAAYRTFLNQRAISDYRATPGNLSVHILERPAGPETHFITLTFWQDEAAIKAFAGDDVLKARYYPEDADFLLEYEPEVVHYTVVGAHPAASDGDDANDGNFKSHAQHDANDGADGNSKSQAQRDAHDGADANSKSQAQRDAHDGDDGN